MPYKTLVIAPKTDLLLVDDEVMQVVNTLGAKLLQGSQANLHGLLAILRESFEIVWFATHGDPQGVYLSDGILNASEITSMVRSCGAVLTVFNTCSSYEVAHAIHGELGGDFICTVKPLPDRQAFITGSIFADKVAGGMDFRSAYEAAKPGQNSTYTFLGAKGILMPPYERGRKEGEPEPLTRLQEIVEQLDAIVFGSTRYNLPGLVKSNESLILKIDALTAEVAQLKANQKVNRGWLITLASVSFLLLIAVIALGYMMGVS